ncbi:MAG TPA: HIT family protein [Ktedonobacterales bacterium]
MRFDRHQPLSAHSPCPFCAPATFTHVLTETPELMLVADNAPLVEGHLLIVPRAHYSCFGATPASLDAELTPLLAEVSEFCATVYRPALIFEHGIFAQSVPHAHLHIVPVGGLSAAIMGQQGAHPVSDLNDVRAYHSGIQHYVYLAQAASDGKPAGALFPPDMGTYVGVLSALRHRSQRMNPSFAPQHIRRMGSGPMMAAVAERWAEWHDSR